MNLRSSTSKIAGILSVFVLFIDFIVLVDRRLGIFIDLFFEKLFVEIEIEDREDSEKNYFCRNYETANKLIYPIILLKKIELKLLFLILLLIVLVVVGLRKGVDKVSLLVIIY